MEEFTSRLISLKDAAQILDKSKVTIWRWVQSGKLRGIPIADRIFVHKLDVERLKSGKDSK